MALYRVRTVISGSLVSGGGLATHYFSTELGLAQDAATAVSGFWGTVAGRVTNTVTFTVQPTVDTLAYQDGAISGSTAVVGSTVTGSLAQDPIPPSNQALLRLRTGVFSDGREIRGRLFIPGIAEPDSTAGILAAAVVTALKGAGDALAANANTQYVVWRRPRPADPVAVPPVAAREGTFAPVTVTDCWTKFAVLRSRRD